MRRFTLREMERLFGFPDDYTDTAFSAAGDRKRALGNTFPPPILRWIGERIKAIDAGLPA